MKNIWNIFKNTIKHRNIKLLAENLLQWNKWKKKQMDALSAYRVEEDMMRVDRVGLGK